MRQLTEGFCFISGLLLSHCWLRVVALLANHNNKISPSSQAAHDPGCTAVYLSVACVQQQ